MFVYLLPQFWLVRVKQDGMMRTKLKSEIKILALPIILLWVGGYNTFTLKTFKTILYAVTALILSLRVFEIIFRQIKRAHRRIKFRIMRAIVKDTRKEFQDFASMF